jgi:hypothetical protein
MTEAEKREVADRILAYNREKRETAERRKREAGEPRPSRAEATKPLYDYVGDDWRL